MYLSVDALPRFVVNMFTVNENAQQVEVCTVLEVESERSVLLSLITQDSTAACKFCSKAGYQHKSFISPVCVCVFLQHLMIIFP